MYQKLISMYKALLEEGNDNAALLSLPEQLLSLRHLCEQPNTDIYDVELGVAQNAPFAAYIIQLSNSALYGGGKAKCENITCALRRLGVYSVSQYALTFALQKRHELANAPEFISALLKQNWQLSWALSQQAIQLYWRHRQSGDESVKQIDISDVLTLGALANTGRLAIISLCSLLHQQGEPLDEVSVANAADKLNLQLLPSLFVHWGLPEERAALFSSIDHNRNQAEAIDYLVAAALLALYGKNRSQQQSGYNFVATAFNKQQCFQLAEQLVALGVIELDELVLEAV